MESHVQHAVRDYKRARAALLRLDKMDAKFKDITQEDLKMPGDIVEENRIGQHSDVLAWFWRLDYHVEGAEGGEIMKECRSLNKWTLLESDIINSLQSELAEGQGPISTLG